MGYRAVVQAAFESSDEVSIDATVLRGVTEMLALAAGVPVESFDVSYEAFDGAAIQGYNGSVVQGQNYSSHLRQLKEQSARKLQDVGAVDVRESLEHPFPHLMCLASILI